MPLILNMVDSVVAFDTQLLSYFSKKNILKLMLNSTLLSFTVAMVSCVVGGALAMLFFALPKRLKQLYMGLLFLFFAIEPIIYLGAFFKIALFEALNPFWQTVITVSPSMMALCGTLFVVALSFINQESIRVSSMVASRRDVMRFIVKPQLLFTLLLAFFMVFIWIFTHSEVSSILGYRTYSEEFLAQINLMESIEQTAIAGLPFYLLALLLLAFLWGLSKKYHIKFYLKEQIESLVLAIDKRVVIALFAFLVSLFLGILTLLGLKMNFAELATLYEDNIEVLFNSLILAFGVSALSVGVSIFLYRLIKKHKVVVVLVFLLLLIPSELIGFEVIKIKQFIGFDNLWVEYFFFVLSSSLKLLPMGVGLVAILYYKDIEDESLRFFSLSKIDIFLKITVPIYYSRWLLIWGVLVIFALNQLSISILLTPIGFEVMIIKIYNLLHYGDSVAVAFLSLMQIGVIVLILALLQRIRR